MFMMFFIIAGQAYGEEIYPQMQLLYQDNKFDELEKLCRAELEKNKKSLESLYFLSAIRLFSGKYEEAIPYMEEFEKYHDEKSKEIASKSPDNKGGDLFLIDAWYIGLYYELGKYHFSNKRYKKAIQWLRMAKARYYQDPMLHFYLGISYYEEGEFDKAIKSFKKELEINPNEPSPFYNISCAYSKSNNLPDAIDWLKKAINIRNKYKDEAKKDDCFENIKSSKSFINLVND